MSRYQKSWKSLTQHTTPKWYLDEKFGLYAHWGLYSVPGFGHEWYGKHMYNPDHPIHTEHTQKIGPVAQTGYTQFIDKFTADQFDAEEWADLFKVSGAGYAGFSLAHHDGFGLWDSDVYRWNVGKMGPNRDLYGELAVALRQKGLKLVAPFHIVRGFNWFLPGWNQFEQTFNEEAVRKGQQEGWELFDQDKADFYWNQFTGSFEDFLSQWVLKVKEVIDKYQPDLMWFDGGRFTEADLESYSLDVLTHYFNSARKWGKEVSVLNKLPTNMKFNFHRDLGIWQFEAGRDRSPFLNRPWCDDMKIGSDSWGYLDDQVYIQGPELLYGLIDRTARGGSLMLSLSPMADGTIPEGQRKPLEHVGTWLSANNEAIHGTVPWNVHAEGDADKLRGRGSTPVHEAAHPHWQFEKSTANDIRYTCSSDGRYLYAITFGQTDKPVKLEAAGKLPENITSMPSSVISLADGAPAAWRWEEDALYIDTKITAPSAEPKVWRITL